MDVSERTLLIAVNNARTRSVINSSNNISLINAIICIVDVFGVFPIVVLSTSILTCGFYGIVSAIVILLLQIYTATLLGRCWLIILENDSNKLAINDRCPYSSLAKITFGEYQAKFINLLLNLTIFCGGIPNLIVASQNFQMLGDRLTILHISFCFWLLIIGVILCPILCIGSPKDLRLVCLISVVLVLLVFVLISTSIALDVRQENDMGDTGNLAAKLLKLYGIITFQFDIHPTILTIQMDMRKKRDVNKAIFCGYFTTIIMVIVVMILAGNKKYDPSTNGSLLSQVTPSTYVNLAALFVTLQLCLSSAIGNCTLYETLEESMNIPRDFNKNRCLLRGTLTLMGIILAETVPEIDMVMSIIGGTLTGPLTFILPPLFYIKIWLIYKKRTENRSKWFAERIEIATCALITITGALMTIANTYVNINDSLTTTTISKSCIMNISEYFGKIT